MLGPDGELPEHVRDQFTKAMVYSLTMALRSGGKTAIVIKIDEEVRFPMRLPLTAIDWSRAT